jgi:succinoglycan biosynthesis transport protein ExoP
MSRLFEALQQSGGMTANGEAPDAVQVLDRIGGVLALEDGPPVVLPHTADRRLVALDPPPSAGSEKFRQLATRLKYAQDRMGIKKMLVTSCMRGEGKSMISANLAISLAANNQKVLLLDGDLRQPRLQYLFDLHQSEGIAEWCLRGGSAMRYVRRAEGLPLWILPAGQSVAAGVAELKPQKVAELLADLERSFDWVLIDAPPVIAFAESLMWAAASERVLMVVREGQTSRKMLNKAVESIEKSKLLGAIFNDTSDTEEKYYDRYYTAAPQNNGTAAKKAAESSSL